jgi:aminoglycoside phosphotransferase (APT) family kinase protein
MLDLRADFASFARAWLVPRGVIPAGPVLRQTAEALLCRGNDAVGPLAIKYYRGPNAVRLARRQSEVLSVVRLEAAPLAPVRGHAGDEGGRCIWYAWQEGTTFERLPFPDAARRAMRLLGRLHGVVVDQAEGARTAARARESIDTTLRRDVMTLQLHDASQPPGDWQRIAEALGRELSALVAAPGRLSLTHNDFRLRNMIHRDDDEDVLVDLDHLEFGSPALELATFLHDLAARALRHDGQTLDFASCMRRMEAEEWLPTYASALGRPLAAPRLSREVWLVARIKWLAMLVRHAGNPVLELLIGKVSLAALIEDGRASALPPSAGG